MVQQLNILLMFLNYSCDRESTFCLMADPDTPEAPLVLALSSSSISSSASHAKYTCVCKQGFYIPNETVQGFQSDKVESDGANFSCVPCPSGCLCDKDGSCMFGDEPEDFITESFLRATIGAIIGACIGCCLILMLVVFRQRKCKVSIKEKITQSIRMLCLI